MTKTVQPTSNRHCKTHVRQLGGGVRLEARVSPCVFMYPGYPLQLTVTLHGTVGKNLGTVYPIDRTKCSADFGDADVTQLLASVQIQPCNRCFAPAFDPRTVETNRGGLCEPCFLADLRTELAQYEEAEQQAIAAQDDRMKRLGMLVRISAWIHPDDGDDRPLDVYLPYRPTAAQVRDLLCEAGSVVSEDFEVIDL